MAHNRRRNGNHVGLKPVAIILAGMLFVGVAGVNYLGIKRQNHEAGDQITRMERELAELESQDASLRAKINQLSSRNSLQRKVDEGMVKLVPIREPQLVRVDVRGEGLRPVSNKRAAE